MQKQSTDAVKPPRGRRALTPRDKFAGVDIYVEFLDGSRAWVPMRELETLRKAFRFVQPPAQA
jgi:hypothetical protein